MAKERTFVGLHAGPAADGAEAAVIAVAGKGERMKVRQLAWVHHALGPDLSRELLTLSSPQPDRLQAADAESAGCFVQAARAALRAAGLDVAQVAACGAIGLPAGAGGLELPSCPRLRLALDVPIAGEFARSDQAAGGLARPPTAWVHWLLLRDRRLSRVLVELGGLARVTFLGSACRVDEVLAFDVAPGMVLLDELARRHFSRPCDRDGALAAGGRICAELLNQLQAHPFLHRPPPKATAAADWLGVFVDRLDLQAERLACRPADRIATVTEWIAREIARSVLHLSERPHEVILSGGGSANIHLAARIRTLLSPSSTYALQRYGFDGQAFGAVCAAVLAAARLDNYPAHHPTQGPNQGPAQCPPGGAAKPTVLGGLW